MKNAIASNPELERRLLSSAMFGPDETSIAAREGVSADVFSVPINRTIWNALSAAAIEDKATDVATVYRKLTGLAGDDRGLIRELSDVAGLEPTSARLRSLAADVVGLWRQRKLITALNAATEAASSNASSWQDVWEATDPHLKSAQDAAAINAPRSLAQIVESARDRILNGDKRAVVHTGISGWDEVASPLRAGELVVLAARPGAGKTALALQMAGHNARNGGGSTAVFSLEMTGEELVIRMAAHSAGLVGVHNCEAKADAAEAIGKLKTLQIYEGFAASSVAQIEARARLLASSPAGLRAVFIDYLQLVAPPPETRRENRERQVAEMSRRFKLMALSLGCPVVLLAQLNRESEKEARRPRLSDLRESGSIEQDADRVWFLYYPEAASEEDADEVAVDLYQSKCRNGRPGIVKALRFHRPTFTFSAK